MYIYYNSIWHILSRKEFIMNVKAILLDTQSIQKYIFSGTKLKTNVGASYIVDRVFEDVLVRDILESESIKKLGIQKVNCTGWESENTPDSVEAVVKAKALPEDGYAAYIGGGNALILFKEEVAGENNSNLKRIVQEFTSTLLCKYPGLKIGAAIGDIQLDEENFSASISAMYQQLQQNKQKIHPVVNVPMTGHTLPCAVNGESANAYMKGGVTPGGPQFISHEVLAKTKMAEEANKKLADDYSDALHKVAQYQFPQEFDNLGSQEGDNYLAIVHIDGNSMGERFNDCKTLADRTKLSRTVATITKKAFHKIVELAASISPAEYLAEGIDVESSAHPYLPMRPIIIGGDDVTFVCHARLAVVLAQAFMKELETLSRTKLKKLKKDKKDKKNKKDTKDTAIYSCAGIAILNASYPFFRGYELAEQMCAKAKENARNKPASWLDFIILHGEQAPTVNQIREQEYTSVKGGQLHFGPYIASDTMLSKRGNLMQVEDSEDTRCILSNMFELVNKFNQLIDSRKMGRNKVKGLRYVLQGSDHMIHDYITKLAYKECDNSLEISDKEKDKIKLPAVKHWVDYAIYGWESGYTESSNKVEYMKCKTPYIDAIEMMEYLPSETILEKFNSNQ